MVYDLDNRADAIRVYEQVMREGTPDDVRFYIDPVRLVDRAGRDGLLTPYRGRSPAWSLHSTKPRDLPWPVEEPSICSVGISSPRQGLSGLGLRGRIDRNLRRRRHSAER